MGLRVHDWIRRRLGLCVHNWRDWRAIYDMSGGNPIGRRRECRECEAIENDYYPDGH